MEVASAGDGLELKADPRTSTKSIPLLIGLCAVGVLIGGGGLALPHLVGSGDEFAADRQAVVTRASDFAVTYNTFSSDKKADYQRRVKPLLTPKSYKDFLKTTDAMFQVASELAKDKTISSRDVKVLSVAVDTIDKDSASAIVAFNAMANQRGGEAVPLRFRYQISMNKVRDKWLVNRIDNVPPIAVSLGDETGAAGNGESR